MDQSPLKTKFRNLLFWSIISAAFIGPGTVTTAASAGAGFGLTLLWALTFSIIACYILQEAAARVTIETGKNLGNLITLRFGRNSGFVWFIFIAIFSGGIAYQGGNILGAISGISLLSSIPSSVMAVTFSIIASFLLWTGSHQLIAHILGVLVAIMALTFTYIAISLPLDWGNVIMSMVVPSLPENSEWIVVALVGTTIVPYNLFLGSGISAGQEVKNMRTGLGMAIILGGILSAAILLAGTQLIGNFDFMALKNMMDEKIGLAGGYILSAGLIAAGFTSAVTAPLATAVTAKSLFGSDSDQWSNQGKKFRLTWSLVIIAGLIFSISGIRPVPAIIFAQALNGLLLPVASIILYQIITDNNLFPGKTNTLRTRLMLLVVMITIFLGLINILKAAGSIFGFQSSDISLYWPLTISIILILPFLISKKPKLNI